MIVIVAFLGFYFRYQKKLVWSDNNIWIVSQFVVLTHVRVKDCDKNSWIVSQSVVLTNFASITLQ